jgi:hypothetical protein
MSINDLRRWIWFCNSFATAPTDRAAENRPQPPFFARHLRLRPFLPVRADFPQFFSLFAQTLG